MRFQTLGNKKEFVSVHVRANEAIPQGTPVCLAISGNEDGFRVALPATAGANHAHALAFGVVTDALASGEIGEAIVFGYCLNALVIRTRTRSDDSASWSSLQSIASFVDMQIDTVYNAFSTSGGTQAASGFLPIAVLCESLASIAGVASGTSNTDTISATTSLQKVFLRMM